MIARNDGARGARGVRPENVARALFGESEGVHDANCGPVGRLRAGDLLAVGLGRDRG